MLPGKCYPDFPKVATTVSFSFEISPVVSYYCIFCTFDVNYGDDYQNGDIIGMKITNPSDETVTRGKITKASMKNCCTFIIYYNGTAVNVKLFNNCFQLCGVPGKTEEAAIEISEMILSHIDKSKQTLSFIKNNTRIKMSELPIAVAKSLKYDGLGAGEVCTAQEIAEHVNHLRNQANKYPIYVESEHEIGRPDNDMVVYTYSIPFMMKSKVMMKIFPDKSRWQIDHNNSKSVDMIIVHQEDNSKITFKVNLNTGSVKQSSNLSFIYNKRIYIEFMDTIIANCNELRLKSENGTFDGILSSEIAYKPQ